MSDELRFRPVGERGLLVELADNRAAQQLAGYIRARFSGRVQEVVPGHTTVLVVGTDDADRRPPSWPDSRRMSRRRPRPASH